MDKSAYLLASGIALGLVVTPALAQQSSTQAPKAGSFLDYAGIGIAISQVTDLSDGSVLVVNGGKNIRGLPGLSVEGEFTSTVSKPETSVGGLNADVSYWTAGAYGVYTLPVTQSFHVRGRLGINYEDVNYSGPGTPSDRTDVKVSAGVGALFMVAPRVGLTADYTRIDEDINHIGAGVQFRF